MNNNCCTTHEQWLNKVHYMCSCGHVEWAHYGVDRHNKERCAHCNCTRYNGETRPLTEYEIAQNEKVRSSSR